MIMIVISWPWSMDLELHKVGRGPTFCIYDVDVYNICIELQDDTYVIIIYTGTYICHMVAMVYAN